MYSTSARIRNMKVKNDTIHLFFGVLQVIKHRKAQKCIMMYNSLAMVFVHYEKIYHKAWFDFVAQVRLGLTMPLLIKHPKTRMYIINFDNYITETIREAEYMRRLKLGK